MILKNNNVVSISNNLVRISHDFAKRVFLKSSCKDFFSPSCDLKTSPYENKG